MKIKTSYQTFMEALKQHRRTLRWVEALARNIAALDPVANICKLGILWDHPGYRGERPPLRLDYCGKAKSHAEAEADLAAIAKALKLTWEKQEHENWTEGRMPKGYYKANGKLGRLRVSVVLEVSWMPEGCKVVRQDPYGGRRYTRQSLPARFSVACNVQ